jgi:hypothetical protein
LHFTCSSSENALLHYNHKGKGHCFHGFYKGWTQDADHATMDAEKCATHCNEEPECLYFAVRPLKTCSRYNSGAGDCPSNGNQDHELYKKKSGMYTMHRLHYGAQTLQRKLHYKS